MPQDNRKNPFSLAPALTLVVLVLLFFGSRIYVSMPVVHYICAGLLGFVAVMLPLLVYCRVCGGTFSSLFPLERPRPAARSLAFSALCVLIFMSALVKYGIFKADLPFSGVTLYGNALPYPASFLQGLSAVLFLAVLPALAEELLLRGAVFYEYRPADSVGTVLLCALFSAFLGGTFGSFLPLFFSALIFSLVRYLTGNLRCVIAIHIGYRIWVLFFEKYFALTALAEESHALYRLLLMIVAGISVVSFFHFAEKTLQDRADCGEKGPVFLPKRKRALAAFDRLTSPMLWILALVFLVTALIRLFV